MNNLSYNVFHTDQGNSLRNYSYFKISNSLSGITKINSPTIFLKSKQDYDMFIKSNPEVSVNIIKDYVGKDTVFPPRSGVIGIFASNYFAWKAFLETDKDALLLFEDDVYLTKNIKYFIDKYISELPEDWDICSFYIPEDVRSFYNSEIHDISNKKYICKSYTNHCAAAYMISRSGAKKAIDDIQKNGISAPLDWYILNVKHLGNEPTIFNVYCIKPNIYMPVKEITEEYYSSSTHYGKTEEFKLNALLS